MIRIGIYSGSFDPLTNGHLWVIGEGYKLFDELHVIIGPNPGKEALFGIHDRLRMLNECIKVPVQISTLHKANIIEYARTLKGEIFLLRGIRDAKDFEYEVGISAAIRSYDQNVHLTFVTPPRRLENISSTHVKELCERQEWEKVKELVPEFVFQELQANFKNKWLVANPPVASIFEATTAGFGPIVGFPVDQPLTGPLRKNKLFANSSMNSHQIPMVDELENLVAELKTKHVVHVHNFGKMRDFFREAVKNGFFKYSEVVTGKQVREMLDPCPYDLVVSETFHLRTISVRSVMPLGERCFPCSQSLGPIIVEANHVLGNEVLGELGPAIVIEGKHRLLDARENGEDTIMAWVGEKILDYLDSYSLHGK